MVMSPQGMTGSVVLMILQQKQNHMTDLPDLNVSAIR